MPAKPKQDERLQAFRGQYGRLCVLVARALTQGHTKATVVEAALGMGDQIAPVYVELRRQRKRMTLALDQCLGSVSRADVVNAGTEAKLVVSAEWMIALPSLSKKQPL